MLLASSLAPHPAVADDALTLVGGNFPPSVVDVEDIVADKAGYYKQEHLAVTKDFAGNAAACFSAVSSGKADVCSSSIEPAILGYSRGVRVTFFISRHPRYDYTLAVLDNSPIKTLTDFKGADIGETNAGSTTEISTNSVLAGAGLHRGDYSYTPIGTGPEALTALTTHRVDALSFPMQELAMMHVAAGLNFRTFPEPRLGDVQNSGVAASPETIAKKPDLLKRYARAMVKAYIFVRVNPGAAARMFLAGTNQKPTPQLLATITSQIETLEPMFPAYDLSDPRIGHMTERGVELYCKFFADAGLTPSIVPVQELVTNEFIGFANDFDKRAVIAQAKAWR
jgi:NitT/TauT family transport system substrate-binding protein